MKIYSTQLQIFCIAIFICQACGAKKVKESDLKTHEANYTLLKELSWILGTWQMNNHDTLSTEQWVQLNDSVYSAFSMDVKAGKDTIRYEDITIEQRGQDLLYIPVVKGHNEGRPVAFKWNTDDPENKEPLSINFTNKEHDFPQNISYQIKEDTLVAVISGPVEGTNVRMRFPMLRVE